jgi:nitroreductase
MRKLLVSWKQQDWLQLGQINKVCIILLLKTQKQAQKFTSAPMFVVGVISESGSGANANGIKYFPLDCGICFEHLILAATAEGLATCWIGWFDETKIRDILEIPKRYRVLALTPIGYPVKQKGEVEERKPLEKIVHYNKF